VAVLPDPVCFFDWFVKTYTTKVQIDHVPAGVRRGMTAQVEILVDDLENVLCVPVETVVRYDGKDHVAIENPDRAIEWRDVTLGRSNDRFAEVRAGIETGERVLLLPPSRSDKELMDGTWKPVAAELAGNPWSQKVLDSMKLTIKDDKYTVMVGDQRDEGTVTRDPKKSPKTMDITGQKGPNEGKTFLAIYELKGDELRVCYDLTGKSRPTEFATKADTLLFLVTYRRAKS
jgi:uncharacterized protein (TIGR03067 family)